MRAVDCRLIAADLRLELRHRGALRIDLLCWGEVAGRQIAKPLQVEPCVGEIRLVLHLFGERLIERGLKGAGIDLCQEIARLDILTLGESDLYQFAIDPGLDRDRVKRLHRAQTGEVDRHIAALRSGDRHRYCRRRRSCCRRGNFGCRTMLPANVPAPRGDQNRQASEEVAATPADQLLEYF